MTAANARWDELSRRLLGGAPAADGGIVRDLDELQYDLELELFGGRPTKTRRIHGTVR